MVPRFVFTLPPTFSQHSSSKSKNFKLSNFHNEASTMKHKAVIKVCMNDDTSRFCCFGHQSSCSRALKVAGGFRGIQSVALGVDKDRIEVTGIFDPVDLTTLLRKKVGYSEILTVSEAGAEDKKESKSKDKPDETKDVPPVICPCPRREIVVIGDPYPERGCWF